MRQLRNNVWKRRKFFCFDEHVPDLTEFFLKVIEKKKAFAGDAEVKAKAHEVVVS